MSSTSMAADWADLPPELISLIFEKLVDNNINNLSNCAALCVSWRSVRAQFINKFSPVVLFTDQGYQKDERGRLFSGPPLNRGEYRLFSTRTGKIQEIILPELCGKLFRSVCPGWLLTINYESPHEVNLLNPLTRSQITLPLPWGGKEYHEFNVVPSSNPSDANCIFLGTYRCGNRISRFCRQGDQTWSTTTINYLGTCICIRDAIFYKGDFYVTGYATLTHDIRFDKTGYASLEDKYDLYMYRIQVDETNMTPTVERLLRLPKEAGIDYQEYYLVELMCGLVLITKFYGNYRLYMNIHKLEVNGDEKRLVRLGTLGGEHAIYLCHFRSVSIYVGESNVRVRCQPNCIYAIKEYLATPPIENGFFDFETDRFKQFRGFPSSTNPLNWFSFQ